MTSKVTIKADTITVDLLLWRRFGVRGRELTAETFAINPGLANAGAYIPAGTVVTLPDLPVASAITATSISLFD
jgi:phage tail protein X